ncbi:MAG: hypothetical protein OHK0029_37040 [Armatimonadaceae bacterium]
MICAVHAVIGAVVGRLAKNRPTAFVAGVSTHLLGDLIPHKDFDPKIEAPLLAATLGYLAWRYGINSPEFIGAFGGIAPDLENAAQVVGLISPDQMVFPTHQGMHHHGPPVTSTLPQGVLAAACVWFLLQSDLEKRKCSDCGRNNG